MFLLIKKFLGVFIFFLLKSYLEGEEIMIRNNINVIKKLVFVICEYILYFRYMKR